MSVISVHLPVSDRKNQYALVTVYSEIIVPVKMYVSRAWQCEKTCSFSVTMI